LGDDLMSKPSEFRLRLEAQLATWSLPHELAAEIEDHCSYVTYERGAFIFARGTAAHLVFWIVKGLAKVYLPLADGGKILVFVARPGEPLGIVESVNESGRRQQILEAQALTKCTVGIIGREHIINLLRQLDGEATIKLLERLNSIWSRMFERFAGFVGLSFRQRLEIVIRDLAIRFGIKDGRGTLIAPELSQEDLAEMIGSSRPMVSKLIADMTQEGLLARSERRLIVRDEAVSDRRHSKVLSLKLTG